MFADNVYISRDVSVDLEGIADMESSTINQHACLDEVTLLNNTLFLIYPLDPLGEGSIEGRIYLCGMNAKECP